MQLTMYTDYSLRVLVYLAQTHGESATITQITDFYRISRNHLVKVVHNLGAEGLIITTRGKHGGMKLAREPEAITIGEVVRRTEPNFNLVECFDPLKNVCVISKACTLKSMLYQANKAFLDVLDAYTLADVTAGKVALPASFPALPKSSNGKHGKVIPISKLD
jgi:Rrf2 family nitric oxide-sensitive transcriptional repressor